MNRTDLTVQIMGRLPKKKLFSRDGSNEVGKIENIDDICKKLIESFGNIRIPLQNEVSALENIGGL